MKRVLAVVTLVAALVPVAALADQCAWMSPDQSREALHFAEKGMKFVDLCEPCGDTLDKVKVQTITSSETRETADGVHHELVINGDAKDTAYVYVQDVPGSNEYNNLAALSKCTTQDVSPKITVTPAPKTKPHTKPKGTK